MCTHNQMNQSDYEVNVVPDSKCTAQLAMVHTTDWLRHCCETS